MIDGALQIKMKETYIAQDEHYLAIERFLSKNKNEKTMRGIANMRTSKTVMQII